MPSTALTSTTASSAGSATTATTSLTASSQKQRYEKMNRMVIQMTLLFIGLTLPIASASSFFAELATTDWGLFVIVLLDCISFTYHGLNIAISYFSNVMFRNEVKRFLAFEKKTPVVIMYQTSVVNQNS
jgi:uncharacterized membrane-anchored protein